MYLYSYHMYLSVGPADEAAPDIRSLSLWEEMGRVWWTANKLKPPIQWLKNCLFGGSCTLRMTVLPKNLSMVHSLAIVSPWTSGRLEMSALVSSVSLKPPNTEAFPIASDSPCSPPEHPFSVSDKAILQDFNPSVSLLQRLTLAFVDISYGLVS